MNPNKDTLGLKLVFSKNLRYYMNVHNKTTTELSSDLDIAYNTVLDWVNGKKYPRMDKVQALADYFNIMKSDLTEAKGSVQATNYSSHEQLVIDAYRNTPSMQEAVDRLLGLGIKEIEDNVEILQDDNRTVQNDTVRVFEAAKSETNRAPGYKNIPRSVMEKLRAAPEAEEL